MRLPTNASSSALLAALLAADLLVAVLAVALLAFLGALATLGGCGGDVILGGFGGLGGFAALVVLWCAEGGLTTGGLATGGGLETAIGAGIGELTASPAAYEASSRKTHGLRLSVAARNITWSCTRRSAPSGRPPRGHGRVQAHHAQL